MENILPENDHHQLATTSQLCSPYISHRKAFFFGAGNSSGNKKKKTKTKRKPVCTCHLGYGPEMTSSQERAMISNLIDGTAYSSSSSNAHQSSLYNMSPSHHQTAAYNNYGNNQQQCNYGGQIDSQQYHHPQQYISHSNLMENQVPEQMSNMSLYSHQQNRNYTNVIDSNVFNDAQIVQHQMASLTTATYSPDLRHQRRHHQQQSQNADLLDQRQQQLRQRRWSDGNTNMSQFDPEYISQQQQHQQNLYLQPKNFLSNCQCNQCLMALSNNNDPYGNQCQQQQQQQQQKPSKPRVSFGPSRMYPADATSSMIAADAAFHQQQQAELFKIQNNQQQHQKKASKLTTELLPLDTQIPLQMMGDSALICNIL